ncbi:MAG TPA: TatD family hydrolase [Armatimonadota bacterium]|nr:TatD family hydrolase [Armatimonadota bacterium]
MIDAHNHLNDPKLLPQIDELLARMERAGVAGALVVGYDLASSRVAVELAQRYPSQLRAAIGVHPHESKNMDAETLAGLHRLAEHEEVVAYGEIGLDYFYDISPRDVQQEAFRRQLHLAGELNLPVVIHERNAVDDTMAILDEEHGWTLGGEWHCCNVTPDIAKTIAQRFYLGIAGWVTFKNSENIRDIVRNVALERLLIETDSPYLTPVPYRGKPNEPAYTRLIAQALAELKGISPEAVEKITIDNTLQAFPRWKRPGEEDC